MMPPVYFKVGVFGAVFGELTSQACCPAGLSSVEAQLPSSFMATASITTSLALT